MKDLNKHVDLHDQELNHLKLQFLDSLKSYGPPKMD